jgi:hypothetical protein
VRTKGFLVPGVLLHQRTRRLLGSRCSAIQLSAGRLQLLLVVLASFMHPQEFVTFSRQAGIGLRAILDYFHSCFIFRPYQLVIQLPSEDRSKTH